MAINRIRLKSLEIIDYEEPISKTIIDTCERGYEKNRRFFGKNWSCPFFKIVICHSEKIFKKEMKWIYAPQTKGGIPSENKIAIRGPKELLECYKKYRGGKSFEGVMAHEICHIFEESHTKKGAIWLHEGVATVVGGRKRKINKDEILKKSNLSLFFYKFNPKKIHKNYLIIYPLYYLATKYLIQKYGKYRLLKLMKTFSKKMLKKDYERNFERIYGKKEKEMIKEFLKS